MDNWCYQRHAFNSTPNLASLARSMLAMPTFSSSLLTPSSSPSSSNSFMRHVRVNRSASFSISPSSHYYAMDSMHPDPAPQPPACLEDIREQVQRLEAGHRARGLPLSGRIIHVFHHLPVEIVCLTSTAPDPFANLSSPITPEFKPEDSTASESVDAKWKIHARRGHTAMVSGIRSLSETHEQIVVAWTGDVLVQPGTASQAPSQAQTPEVVKKLDQPKMLLQDTVELHPLVSDQTSMMVYNGEFEAEEQQEIESELKRFSDVQFKNDGYGKLEYIPVFLPRDVSKGHYEGYCKASECMHFSLLTLALWPLFHYLLWLDSTATVPSPDPSWAAYKTANEIFAKRVADVYRPGDLVIVHDYHLLLAPKLIREALGQGASIDQRRGSFAMPSPAVGQENDRPNWDSGSVTSDKSRGNLLGKMLGEHLVNEHSQAGEIMIGLFMHTPWPSSEIFRCLPREYGVVASLTVERKDILEGMLGANLVSFQTYSYSRHFVSSCIRVCGFESTSTGVDVNGQSVVVTYCPIGIDIQGVAHARDAPNVKPKTEALRALYHDKKIIVGREKLDAPKGVYNKLQAFEKFLQVYPEWRNKVVLIQVTTPALSESPKLEREVAEMVSHINSTYGSLDFTPVHH